MSSQRGVDSQRTRISRRTMLASLGAALAAGGLYRWVAMPRDIKFSELPQGIQELYDPKYGDALQAYSDRDLEKKLHTTGVYDGERFDLDALRRTVQVGELLEFDGLNYPEQELVLYAWVARLKRIQGAESAEPANPELALFPGVDLMGGDLRSFVTADAPKGGQSRSQACVDACREDTECLGFTFAKTSHPAPGKRGRCWLKKEGFRFFRNDAYVSGIKAP